MRYPGGNLDLNAEIFLADDGSLVQVTDSLGSTQAHPVLSADGSVIVFESDGDLVPGGNTDGNQEIFLADLTTGLLEQVTQTVGANSFGQANRTPKVSADGRRIAFESTRDLVPGGNCDGSREIFVYDRDQAAFTQVTATLSTSLSPDISSDGQRVVYVQSLRVYLHDLGTGATLQLTTSGFSAQPSVDGARVAFRSSGDPLGSNPDRSAEIFLADCSGKL